MDAKGNPEQIKRLVRVLKNLHNFELVICGYQSISIFHEILRLVHQNSAVEDINVFDIDVSGFKPSHDFQNNLSGKINKKTNYAVFNIIGMESQVKEGEQSVFLNNLNLQRDRLASKFPYSFIFWLPENLIKRFTLDAPDLWAWRNTVLVLEDEDRKMRPKDVVMEPYERNAFSNFTLKEKTRHTEYLLELEKRLQKEDETYKRQKKLATVYSDLADIYRLMGDYEQALNYYKDSVKIQEKSGDQQGLAALLNTDFHSYRNRHNTPPITQSKQFPQIFHQATEQ